MDIDDCRIKKGDFPMPVKLETIIKNKHLLDNQVNPKLIQEFYCIVIEHFRNVSESKYKSLGNMAPSSPLIQRVDLLHIHHLWLRCTYPNGACPGMLPGGL